MSATESAAGGDGLLGRIEAIRRRLTMTGPMQGVIIAATIVALVIGAVLAWDRLPPGADLTLTPLLLSGFLAVPLTLALNVVEFAAVGRIAGVPTTWRDGARVTLYGSAANLLPVPGAALVRVRVLHREGMSLRRASALITAVGVLWVTASLGLAGALVLPHRTGIGGFLLLGALLTGALGSTVLAKSRVDRPGLAGELAAILLIESVMVIAHGFRIHLAVTALGLHAPFSESVTIAASAALAAAVGFLPGGLGLREAAGAFLGSLVGLGAANGLLVVIIDRVVLSVALVPFALVFFLTRQPESDPPPGAGAP